MRWLLALHGDTPLQFAYGPLLAGDATRVLRNAATPEQRVARAEDYEQLLQRCAAQGRPSHAAGCMQWVHATFHRMPMHARDPVPRPLCRHVPRERITLDLEQRRADIWAAAQAAAAEVRDRASQRMIFPFGLRPDPPPPRLAAPPVLPSPAGPTRARTCPHTQAGGSVPDSCRGDLLEEVANLVESPTVVRGAFDPAFLDLPE